MLYLEIPGRALSYLVLLLWIFWGFWPAFWLYCWCAPSFTEDDFFDEDGEFSIVEAMTYELPPDDFDLDDMECVFFLAEHMPYYEDRVSIL